MLYLFIQIWIWILIAGIFGLFIGWLIWGRGARRKSVSTERSEKTWQERRSVPAIATSPMPDDKALARDAHNQGADHYQVPPSTANIFDDETKTEERPQALSGPQGEPDDLKRIKGVGPVIERKLNDVGIFHFHQIAAFSDENIRWIDNNLAFPGRVNREQWVGQAKLLEMGVSTEFSDRYDNK